MYGGKMASLLESRSMASLVQQSYFDRDIKPKLGPAKGPEAISNNLFNLKGPNGGEIPITRYFEMDVTFLGLKVPSVRFLVRKNPNELIQSKKKTKLLIIIK